MSTPSRQAIKTGFKQVKPILSVDDGECRRRALNLYRAWYRTIPTIVNFVDIPKNVQQCREKLREEFYKHKHEKDIRVRDLLVIKGQMELKETAAYYQQKGHMMARWKDTQEPKAKDFLSKFFSNQ